MKCARYKEENEQKCKNYVEHAKKFQHLYNWIQKRKKDTDWDWSNFWTGSGSELSITVERPQSVDSKILENPKQQKFKENLTRHIIVKLAENQRPGENL